MSKVEGGTRIITDGFMSVFTLDQFLGTSRFWGSRNEERASRKRPAHEELTLLLFPGRA